MSTFAAQAAIAIRNVDLVRDLQARTTELADKIGQLEALREIGHVVSSSLDLDEVLTTIVSHAVQLTDTDGGSLLELDAASQEFRIRAAYGTTSGLLERLGATHISLENSMVGKACVEGQPQMAEDLATAPLDPHLGQLKDAGWRSVLAVPMQHEAEIVGALVVRRRRAGGFSDASPTSCRPSRASPRSPSSMPGCSGSCSAELVNLRWPAGTSLNFSRACRTSCGHR